MLKEKKAGFTLLELIIVVSLTVVVLGITSSIFITGNKVFSDSDVKSTLQIEAQRIQEEISKVGMEATGIQSIAYVNIERDKDNSINILNKDIDIVDENYEQLKSENRLTDINGNKDPLNNKWVSISQILMNYYEEDNLDSSKINLSTTPIPIIQFKKANSDFILSKDKNFTVLVAGKELSSNVKSVRIQKSENGTFKDAGSILINIELAKRSGFSDVTYPISFTITFRNRNIS